MAHKVAVKHTSRNRYDPELYFIQLVTGLNAETIRHIRTELINPYTMENIKLLKQFKDYFRTNRTISAVETLRDEEICKN